MTTLTWRQQAEAAFRSAMDGAARVTGSRDAMTVTALHAALDVAEPLIRAADGLGLGGMELGAAVCKTVERLGKQGWPEWRIRLLRDLYRAGVGAGIRIWQLKGDPEPEQVTAIRRDRAGRHHRPGRAVPGPVRPGLPARRVRPAVRPARIFRQPDQKGTPVTDLKLTEGAIGDVGVIQAAGELDLYTAPELRESLRRMDVRGYSRILLDLTACTYLDATGLGTIVGGLRRARGRGGDLMLVEPGELVMKVFRTTGLAGVFTFFASRDMAVEAIGRADG